MYNPKDFTVDDRQLLHELMARFSFATLVTVRNGVPEASHIPLLHRAAEDGPGSLLGHMARANPQWHDFLTDTEVLAIFQGHHAYISPSWYTSHPSVPTWNYMVVHAYGLPRIIEDDSTTIDLLRDTVDYYERSFPKPWPMDLPTDYLQRRVKAIVAFEIRLTRIEGKHKLSQNRDAHEQAGVVEALDASPSPADRELAKEMRRLVLRPAADESQAR